MNIESAIRPRETVNSDRQRARIAYLDAARQPGRHRMQTPHADTACRHRMQTPHADTACRHCMQTLHAGMQACRHAGRHADRQAGRHADRQTGRQALHPLMIHASRDCFWSSKLCARLSNATERKTATFAACSKGCPGQ